MTNQQADPDTRAKAWRRMFFRLLPKFINIFVSLLALFIIATAGLIWLSTQVRW